MPASPRRASAPASSSSGRRRSRCARFGLKHTAREIAARERRAAAAGHRAARPTRTHALPKRERIGYPVMLKSTAGGGGIGMRVCRDAGELARRASTPSQRLERSELRHRRRVPGEVRRAGAPHRSADLRRRRGQRARARRARLLGAAPQSEGDRGDAGARPERTTCAARLWDAARDAWRARCSYRSAGTVEFLYDADREDFFFLEVNTRLQVEHGVTEEVTGVDLVEWMVRLAAGELPPLETLRVRAARALDPGAHLRRRSRAGLSARARACSPTCVLPPGARCETWVETGTEVTPFYDPMLAKIIVHGDDARRRGRAAARRRWRDARSPGSRPISTTCGRSSPMPSFSAGGYHHQLPEPRRTTGRRAFEVLEPGMQTTVQDYPGRLGYWHVGVPPSGPMDALAFRLANRLVGNPESRGRRSRCTMTGPDAALSLPTPSIALTGADMARDAGRRAGRRAGSAIEVPRGLGAASWAPRTAPGARAYLAVRGGIDVPEYLGSRVTFILGKFGGHAGRVLRAGDVLRWRERRGRLRRRRRCRTHCVRVLERLGDRRPLRPARRARFLHRRRHRDVLRDGVEGALQLRSHRRAPDRTEARSGRARTAAKRACIRRTSTTTPTPSARWTSPATCRSCSVPTARASAASSAPPSIAHAELWKMGQLRAGRHGPLPADHQRRRPTRMERELDAAVATLSGALPAADGGDAASRPSCTAAAPRCYRAAGDRYLLVEYGPNVLDLNLRFRVHALEQLLRAAAAARHHRHHARASARCRSTTTAACCAARS